MLEAIKDDIDTIIAERSTVLVHSEFVSVREAVHRIEQARQAEGRTHAPATGVPAVSMQAEEEEDHKMPSLPRITTFTTLEEAQEAVHTFLERWHLETPSGCEAIQEQGQTILQGVAALEATTSKSYEQQVLGFSTQDVDPFVWNEVLQEQEVTRAKLITIIGLRGQLLHILPPKMTVHPTQRSNVQDQAAVGILPQGICESLASYRQACESDEAFLHQQHSTHDTRSTA
jgi:hypothetical protein